MPSTPHDRDVEALRRRGWIDHLDLRPLAVRLRPFIGRLAFVHVVSWILLIALARTFGVIGAFVGSVLLTLSFIAFFVVVALAPDTFGPKLEREPLTFLFIHVVLWFAVLVCVAILALAFWLAVR